MADLSSLLGAAGIGGAIGKAIVSLELDTTKYQAELKAANAETVASANSSSAAVGNFSKFASTALLGVGVAAVAGAALSIKAAIDANEAHLKLQNTFENNNRLADSSVQAFEAQADALRDLTGVDDEAINGAQALLGQFKLTGSQVTELIPLIVDLSAKMGIDLEAAAKAVGKATQGSSGALSRYGIILDKDKLSADAFGTTLHGLGVVAGFAAERAQEEPWRVLGVQFQEIAEQVGQALLPSMKDLVGTVKALLPLVTLLAGNLDKFAVSAGAAWVALSGFGGPVTATVAGLVAFGVVLKTDSTALGVFEEDLATGTIGVETFDAQTARLADRLGTTREQLLGTSQSMGEMRAKAGLASEGVLNLAGDTAELKTHVKETQERIANFAHMTTTELKDWSDKTKESFQSYVINLDKVQEETDFTRKDLRDSFRAMLEHARNLNDAMRTLSREHWINDDFVKFLAEQPDKLILFADSNETQQRRMQHQWELSGDILKHQINDHLDDMIGVLDKLDKGESKHTVIIEYRYEGFDPSKPGMSGSAQQR